MGEQKLNICICVPGQASQALGLQSERYVAILVLLVFSVLRPGGGKAVSVLTMRWR